MIIFADTSALVSLFNPLDPNHEKAKILAKRMQIKSYLISNYTFAETVTILSQKVGKEKATYSGELMKKRFKEIKIDPKIDDLAWEIFKKQKSKNVSFVDCTTFALFKIGVFDKAFTFDNDFETNRIPVLE